MTNDEAESLSEAWLSRWGGSPIAYELRDRHADRWVRFHSLPASKRYAETEEEYGVPIMATAANDGLIRGNPCRVKGAGTEQSPERPLLTVAQVYALADACGDRYRAMFLLACFGGLRWGELATLSAAATSIPPRQPCASPASCRSPRPAAVLRATENCRRQTPGHSARYRHG